jgi:RNA polymerase I-specific transcription initiation factor RRN7
LQDLLGVTFHYPKPRAVIERKKSHFLPDVQLIVLIVIATKLLFPFDDLKRYPTTSKEPAAQTMDWSKWARSQEDFSSDSFFGENIGKGTALQVTDKDVMNMTNEQMDNYMDWYASNWLDTSKTPGRLADMFPIHRVEEPQPTPTTAPGASSSSAQPAAHDATQGKLDALLHKAMQELKARRVIPEEDEQPRRPGEVYSRYRWESHLSGTVRTFYEIAAKLAAVPLRTLVRAVTLTEIHIAQIDEKRQHREYFANQGVEVHDSDDADDDYAMDEF